MWNYCMLDTDQQLLYLYHVRKGDVGLKLLYQEYEI